MKTLTLVLVFTAAALLASANRAMQVQQERSDALKAQAEVTTKRAVSERAPLEAAIAPASADKIKDLQKERIATLEEVAEMSLKLAQGSRLELGVALEDRIALLEAQLGAAETEPERIALYKRTVDALTAYDDLAKAQKQAARGTELDVLRVKSLRLEVEIRLEQAKAKGSQAGK